MRIRDARMDLVVARPGAATRWLVDVRTLDARGSKGEDSQQALIKKAENGKTRRYFGTAWTFLVELRGGLSAGAEQLLEHFAMEATRCRLGQEGLPASTLVRRWSSRSHWPSSASSR